MVTTALIEFPHIRFRRAGHGGAAMQRRSGSRYQPER
jgi:hypothetical protein